MSGMVQSLHSTSPENTVSSRLAPLECKVEAGLLQASKKVARSFKGKYNEAYKGAKA